MYMATGTFHFHSPSIARGCTGRNERGALHVSVQCTCVGRRIIRPCQQKFIEPRNRVALECARHQGIGCLFCSFPVSGMPIHKSCGRVQARAGCFPYLSLPLPHLIPRSSLCPSLYSQNKPIIQSSKMRSFVAAFLVAGAAAKLTADYTDCAVRTFSLYELLNCV